MKFSEFTDFHDVGLKTLPRTLVLKHLEPLAKMKYFHDSHDFLWNSSSMMENKKIVKSENHVFFCNIF